MSATVITCTPPGGILTISADTIAALDRLAETLPESTPWQVDVHIGWTPADTRVLTATPATTDQEAA